MGIDISKISTPNLWYLVGLITSDGCLSPDGRHVDITQKDYKFLFELKKITGITNNIGIKNKNSKAEAYRLQISSKSFYLFLISIGLKTKKSLDLGKLKIPNSGFCDFLRGLIDGDGNIRRWMHPSNGREQWILRITSASIVFLRWLKSEIEDSLQVKGRMHCITDGQLKWYILKYGKMAARTILKNCYYENAFGLERKINLANKCMNSNIGWKRSKTVLN